MTTSPDFDPVDGGCGPSLHTQPCPRAPTLAVCHCPCGMTPETPAGIIASGSSPPPSIATPVHRLPPSSACPRPQYAPVLSLPPAYLSAWRNAAHGVSTNPADQSAMLPRHLDLFAQDQCCDPARVGLICTVLVTGAYHMAPCAIRKPTHCATNGRICASCIQVGPRPLIRLPPMP